MENDVCYTRIASRTLWDIYNHDSQKSMMIIINIVIGKLNFYSSVL